ncbi:MAG: hypothetical protein PVG39_24435 [Desulfobacteraceae bacterium]|jgi:hypothetical protein
MSKLQENSNTPEELRKIREKRITDTIRLKIPDRVTVFTSIGYFAARYAAV